MNTRLAFLSMLFFNLAFAAEADVPRKNIHLTVFAERDHAWTDGATVMPEHMPGSPQIFGPTQGTSPWMFVMVVNSDGSGKAYECPRSLRCELDSIEVTRDYFGILVMNHRIGSVLSILSAFEKRFHLVNAGVFRSSKVPIQPEKAKLIQNQLLGVAKRYGLNMPDLIRAGAVIQSMAPLQEMRDFPSKFDVQKMEECLPDRPCFPKGGHGGLAFGEVSLSRCEDVAARVNAVVMGSAGPTVTLKADTEAAACDAVDYVWSFGDGRTQWTKIDSVVHEYGEARSYVALVGARCTRKRESACVLGVARVSVNVP